MKTFNPSISIIIPVYNGANYLASAIESALAQDYQDFEVIVVNDGSRDETEKIAFSYGDRIRYFFKENGGVATALNFGIGKAAGDYISWLSHDDMYSRDKLSSQVQELRKHEFCEKFIPYSDYRVINVIKREEFDVALSEFDPVISRNDISSANDIMLLLMIKIHGCSLLIPKKAFEECGCFDPSQKTTQDYHKWFLFVENGYHFIHVGKVLVFSRVHPDQDTKKKRRLCKKEQHELFDMAMDRFVRGNPYGLSAKQLEFANNRYGFGSLLPSLCKWTWRFIPVRSLRVAMRDYCRSRGGM